MGFYIVRLRIIRFWSIPRQRSTLAVSVIFQYTGIGSYCYLVKFENGKEYHLTEKDFTQKTLEACNDVFADIVNVLLFHGEYIVKEKELETETAQAVYKLNQKLHEEERDVAKYWRNSRVRIAFYGIENQISKDSDMPLRVIGYDGAAYRGQLLKEPEDEQHPYHKQHLYREEKHRYPVITLVLYFGNRRWKRPLSLKDRVQVPERTR